MPEGAVASVCVVICTKDRPEQLTACLEVLAASGSDDERLPVLVVDASADDRTRQVCLGAPAGLALEHVSAPPGLAAQRNTGLARARARDADLLLFLDDDVRVRPGYVAAVRRSFADHPEAAGVGAVVDDEPPVRLIPLKAVFLLWSRRRGAVLRSGRNVLGHTPDGTFPRPVEWLSTCGLSLQLRLVDPALRFDERLQGYSYGEDLDFTFRLSREQPLLVTGLPHLQHLQAGQNRPQARAQARRRTLLLHAWVTEMHARGLRRRWFWWSVVGEVLLLGGAVLTRAPDAGAQLAGVLEGAGAVARGRSSRRA